MRGRSLGTSGTIGAGSRLVLSLTGSFFGSLSFGLSTGGGGMTTGPGVTTGAGMTTGAEPTTVPP